MQLRYDFIPSWLVLGALVVFVAGCASRTSAPVEDRRAQAKPGAPAPAAVGVKPAAPPAPEPDWRPQTYTVKRGDTLHGIALEHGLDYRELAGWNALDNPNLIRVGQVLRLNAPGDPRTAPGATAMVEAAPGVTVAPLRSAGPIVESPASTAVAAAPAPAAASSSAPAPTAAAPAARNTDMLKVGPKAVRQPWSAEAAKEMARVQSEPVMVARAPEPVAASAPSVPPQASPPPVLASAAPSPQPSAPPPPVVPAPAPAAGTSAAASSGDEGVDWIWPAKGKLVTGFSDTANLKGIDIAGTAGQPVIASASGRVVYAGSGLRGYGKLVIIKHNNTFLSAYAHNREILVKEGQQVKRGEKIAEMGSTDTDQVKLHFEIRRLGKPMDPLKYLPPG